MKKVLIVEDELVLVFNLRQYINRMGYITVDTVADGLTAIASVKENQPDIILMDIRIRGMIDGIQTMSHIREFSQVPVIYTIDPSDLHIREQAANTPHACLLYKPLKEPALKEMIDHMLTSFHY